jgi:hypothetical protein
MSVPVARTWRRAFLKLQGSRRVIQGVESRRYRASTIYERQMLNSARLPKYYNKALRHRISTVRDYGDTRRFLILHGSVWSEWDVEIVLYSMLRTIRLLGLPFASISVSSRTRVLGRIEMFFSCRFHRDLDLRADLQCHGAKLMVERRW